jgi:hypothetical protein
MLYMILENDGIDEAEKSPIQTSTNKQELEEYARKCNIGHKTVYPAQDNYYYVVECPLKSFLMEYGSKDNRSYKSYRLSSFTPEEQESILTHYAKDGVADYFHWEDVLGDRSLLWQKRNLAIAPNL